MIGIIHRGPQASVPLGIGCVPIQPLPAWGFSEKEKL
jgi:hypothetical protein